MLKLCHWRIYRIGSFVGSRDESVAVVAAIVPTHKYSSTHGHKVSLGMEYQ